MIRYPHTLTVKWKESPTLVNGRPTSATTVTKTITCRYEVNGSGRFVQSESGVNIIYSYKIHSDRLSYSIPVGAEVEIDGRKYVVIKHDNLQLSSRVWV